MYLQEWRRSVESACVFNLCSPSHIFPVPSPPSFVFVPFNLHPGIGDCSLERVSSRPFAFSLSRLDLARNGGRPRPYPDHLSGREKRPAAFSPNSLSVRASPPGGPSSGLGPCGPLCCLGSLAVLSYFEWLAPLRSSRFLGVRFSVVSL